MVYNCSEFKLNLQPLRKQDFIQDLGMLHQESIKEWRYRVTCRVHSLLIFRDKKKKRRRSQLVFRKPSGENVLYSPAELLGRARGPRVEAPSVSPRKYNTPRSVSTATEGHSMDRTLEGKFESEATAF